MTLELGLACSSDRLLALFVARSAGTHHSASDTNVYEGRTARGRVTHTLSRGRLAWADGELRCAPGTAHFVPTPPFAPSLFGGMAERDAAAAQARRPVPREGDYTPAADRATAAAASEHHDRRDEL